jgi:type IV fimbrial biogenesis protein FimT
MPSLTGTEMKNHLHFAPRHRNPNGRQRGLSLLESLVSLATTLITLTAAVPSFEASRVQRHLDGTAAQLETDILFTRSLAVAQGRTLRMSFHTDAHGSGYVVHSGPANGCSLLATGQAQCQAGVVAARAVRLPAGTAVQLQSNVGSIVFDADKGTSTPTGTLKLQAGDHKAVHLVVNIMGRVRSCSPAAKAVKGYVAC